MHKLLIATNNNYKKSQFAYLLQNYNISVYTLKDMGLEWSVEENWSTPEENAIIKANYRVQKANIPTLADDSWMQIDALGGEPGVKARRWWWKFEDWVSDKEWLDYLLRRMEWIPFEDRTARFQASWVLVFPGWKKFVKNFDLEFVILEEPVGSYPEWSPISAVRYIPRYQQPETMLTSYQIWDELVEHMEDFDIENKIKNNF